MENLELVYEEYILKYRQYADECALKADFHRDSLHGLERQRRRWWGRLLNVTEWFTLRIDQERRWVEMLDRHEREWMEGVEQMERDLEKVRNEAVSR